MSENGRIYRTKIIVNMLILTRCELCSFAFMTPVTSGEGVMEQYATFSVPCKLS